MGGDLTQGGAVGVPEGHVGIRTGCSANSNSVPLSRKTGKTWGGDQETQANSFQSNWGEKPHKRPGWKRDQEWLLGLEWPHTGIFLNSAFHSVKK